MVWKIIKKSVKCSNLIGLYSYILGNQRHESAKEYVMKERFKQFLEEHFKKIAPTQASMEYRKTLLRQLLDREQELRIKGVSDDELIFEMAISELGDIDQTLKNFENMQVKNGQIKRKISAGTICAIAVVVLLGIVYVIVGAATGIWHPTWLIMVGGIFAGVAVMLGYLSAKFIARRKFIPLRVCVAVCEVLLAVFVFLVLQLLFNLAGAWMTFLAMVALLFGVDCSIAFVTNSKTKWFELPIFVELFGVMLYVILGITVQSIWHPGWLMCLAGVVCLSVEVCVFTLKRAKAKKAVEDKKFNNKHVVQDEKYWTEWDD